MYPPRRLALVLVGALLSTFAGSARAETPLPSDARADHVRVAALGGVGFPELLSVEGLVQLERRVAVGLEYGALPKLTLGNVEIRSWALAGDARIFPWRGGPFFLGLRAGYQHLDASASVSVAALTLSGTATVNTWFLNPRMGFFWSWSLLTVGVDAGAQVPVTVDTSSSLPGSAGDTVTSTAQSFGGTILPTVSVRMGFVL